MSAKYANEFLEVIAPMSREEKIEFISSIFEENFNQTLDYILTQWGSKTIPVWVNMNYGGMPSELHPVMKTDGVDQSQCRFLAEIFLHHIEQIKTTKESA